MTAGPSYWGRGLRSSAASPVKDATTGTAAARLSFSLSFLRLGKDGKKEGWDGMEGMIGASYSSFLPSCLHWIWGLEGGGGAVC